MYPNGYRGVSYVLIEPTCITLVFFFKWRQDAAERKKITCHRHWVAGNLVRPI